MKPDLVSQKIESLRTMTGIKSTRPDIPVPFAVQEAYDLYEWCKSDREEKVKWTGAKLRPEQFMIVLYIADPVCVYKNN